MAEVIGVRFKNLGKIYFLTRKANGFLRATA